jgi:predicted ABC-type ATPase
VPTLIIIAGPNGAGKTTFADEYLAAEERRFEFVNADEIARSLSREWGQVPSDVLAARLMLHRVEELVEAGADFAIETTLANLTYAQKIPAWRKLGYLVSLAYLRLESLDESIARPQARAGWRPWYSGGRAAPEVRQKLGLFRNHLSADRR